MLWAALAVGSVLSCIVTYRFATMSLVLGSEAGNWVYIYLQGFHIRSIEVFLRVAVVCGVLCAIPLRVARRYEWPVVFLWLLVGFALQGQLRSLAPYSVEQVFVSDGSNSFYTPTQHYEPRTLLADFDRHRLALPTHAQSNMPGKLMLVFALEQVSNQPAVLAWLVVALSNLGGILLYLFARDLFADRTAAIVALIFYLFVPAKVFFFPVLNTVTPVVALLFAYLWLRWLRTARAPYAILLGVTFYGLLFYEPMPLVLGLLFGAFTAQALWRAEIGWRTLLVQVGLAAMAFAATYVTVLAWFGFNLFATLSRVSADAVAFNAAHRPYAVWVWRNLVDFLFGVGVCQAVIFCVLVGYCLHRAYTRREAEPIVVFCLSSAALLLATDLLGVNRGEVVRLWIFLACFLQIPAAFVCARLHSRVAVMLVLGTTLLQDALGTAMFNFAQP